VFISIDNKGNGTGGLGVVDYTRELVGCNGVVDTDSNGVTEDCGDICSSATGTYGSGGVWNTKDVNVGGNGSSSAFKKCDEIGFYKHIDTICIVMLHNCMC